MLSLLRVVVAVELWGGLDGFLASVTLGENESVDGGERGELRLGCGVRARDVCDAGTTHVAHPQRQGLRGARSLDEQFPRTQTPNPFVVGR